MTPTGLRRTLVVAVAVAAFAASVSAWAPIGTATAAAGGDPGGVDYGHPSEPQVLGTGDLDAVTPDGTAVIVSDVDDRFSQPGCEGLPSPVLFRVPLDGGEREPLRGDDGQPIQGHGEFWFLGAPGARVALLDDCEEYLGGILVAREATDGRLDQVVEVPEEADRWPQGVSAGTIAWSTSGSALLAAGPPAGEVGNPNPDGDPVIRIEVPSGTIQELFRSPEAVFQIGQLPDGRLVYATDHNVRIRNEDGGTAAEFSGNGFAIGPDGTLAVLNPGVTLVSPSGEARVLVEPSEGTTIWQAEWSPGGDALAYLSDVLEVVTLDGHVTGLGPARPIVRGSPGGSAFSPDGRLLAFNRPGSQPDAENEVVVVRFGSK
jgi:hypothetical protein